MRIIQSSSCTGHQESQHDVGAGVFSLVPSVPLALSLLGFYLILEILQFSGIAPDFLAGVCGSKGWRQELVVLTGLKLVFHDGNPGSQGDLELKTELFYY